MNETEQRQRTAAVRVGDWVAAWVSSNQPVKTVDSGDC